MTNITYKTKPREYQKNTIEDVLSKGHKFFALNADPGLGKTKMSLDIAVNLYLRGEIDWCLVFAPNGVHTQWITEQCDEHIPIPFEALEYSAQSWQTVRFQNQLKGFYAYDGFKIIAFNIDVMSTPSGADRVREVWKTLGREVFCIVDESHTIKNHKANRSKTMHKVGNTAKYRCTLTGTPVTNSPFDLWSQYEFLKHDYFGMNYFLFEHAYGIIIKRQGNGRSFRTLVESKDIAYVRKLIERGLTYDQIAAISGISASSVMYIKHHPELEGPYKDLDKLRESIAPITYTLRKEDHLDLPDKIFSPIFTDLASDQKKAYKQLQKEYETLYQGKELTLENKLTLSLRLMQITGGFFPYDEGDAPVPFSKNPKMDRLLEDLEETDGTAIIIWAVFRAEIEGIRDAIKTKWKDWRVATYYGGTPQKERQGIVEDFQKGKINVLVANLASAGTGLNLQRSNLHYFYSNDFSLSKRVQGEDRSHRIGQTRSVTYKDIYIRDTVDQKIALALKNRKDVLDYFREAGNIF